jgi:hypothetical protein
MTEHAVGSLRTTPIPALADRAARVILTYASPRAVSCDPEGRVRVESPHEAAEVDLVGVYVRELGILALSRALIDDLRFEASQRKAAA